MPLHLRLLFVAGLIASLPTWAATGSLSPEVLLAPWADTDAYTPAVAKGDGGYLVVWQAGRLMNGNLVGARFDAAGAPTDPAPFAISLAADDQERPRVAFGGGVYFVVWQDLRNRKDYDVRAARVTPAGVVLDGEGILVAGGASNQANPRVSFDGTDFIVAWETFRSGLYEVHAARVAADGTLKDPEGVPVERAPSGAYPGFHRFMPDVASAADGQSLVLWHGAQHYWAGQGSQWGSAFLRAGAVESKLDYSATRAAPVPQPACVFSLAAGPDNWLATWRNLAQVGRGNPSNDANMTLISKNGTPGAALTLLGRSHQILDPSTSWDGAEYLTAWGEQRTLDRRTFDLVLAIATSPVNGSPLTDELAIAGTFERPARHAALASNGARQALVVYEQHPASGAEPIRIGARLITVQ